MTPLSLALRNLLAHRLRTAATLAGIALAIASFVALVGLARGLEATLRGALEARGTEIIVSEAGASDLMASILPEETVARAAAVPGVAAAVPELARMTSIENGATVLVIAWPPGAYPWQTLDLRAGRLPAAGEARVAVLGASLAERLGLAAGGTLRLFHEAFRVVGIAESESLLLRNLVLVPLAEAQTLTFRQGQATAVNIRAAPGLSVAERAALLARLRAALPGASVEETGTVMRGQVYGRVADILSWAISLVAMLSAALTVLNTMAMAVNERRGEIAILGAIGWGRARIVGVILAEGMLLALAGGAAGVALGVGAAEAVAASPSVSGFVAPAIGPALAAQALLVALLLGLAGSLWPALRASAASPAEVLRGR